MGAAGEQDMPPALAHHQALFMGKIVLHPAAVGPAHRQFPVAPGPEPPPGDPRKQKQFFIQAAVAVQQAQPRQFQDGFVDADVPLAVEKFPRRAPLHIDAGPRGQRRRLQQPARVVVVAVAQHDGIHPPQVQPQHRRVGGEGAGGAGVHQQGMAAGLDVQAQAVLVGAARYAGGVFDQGDDAHGAPSFRVLPPV